MSDYDAELILKELKKLQAQIAELDRKVDAIAKEVHATRTKVRDLQ